VTYDPIPASLVKNCASVLVPTITKIINLSFSSGAFLKSSKLFSSFSCKKNQILINPYKSEFQITGLP
jgi:hypothetical protein